MKKITVSAPGKLMLFGEHAVIYGHPCIVTAVGQRLYLTVSQIANSKSRIAELQVEAPDVAVTNYTKSLEHLGEGDIPKGARFIEIAVKNFAEKYQINTGLRVTTKSDFSSLFGFGSSSASTVCVIKALSELFEVSLSNKEIFDLAYKTVLDIQGKGSGFDVAAAIYGGTLGFVAGGKVIESLAVDELPLVVGYSGVKADTTEYIKLVSEKAAQFPEIFTTIFDQIAALTTMAKFALIEKDWKTVGDLMNINQGYLEAIGVSTGKLSSMIYAARDAGALGAKLSGAGGGDCIVALTANSTKQSVQKAIEKAGGQVIDVATNVEGVRLEK